MSSSRHLRDREQETNLALADLNSSSIFVSFDDYFMNIDEYIRSRRELGDNSDSLSDDFKGCDIHTSGDDTDQKTYNKCDAGHTRDCTERSNGTNSHMEVKMIIL